MTYEPGLSDRTKLTLFWPIAGFFVVAAFGIGVISMASFHSRSPSYQAVSETDAGQTIQVELGDLFITPAALEATAGAVTFEVTNGGKTDHNFAIQGLGATQMLAAGDSARLTIPDLAPGDYAFICEVAGHADGGMKGTLHVDGDGAGAAATSSMPGMSGMTAQEMMAHDAEVTGSFPAETKGVGGTDLDPKMVDGVKVFEVTADEIDWEIAPGDVKPAYAYNGMIPGPTLRADMGDRVRIVLHNELAEPTTIHFHGMTVPADMDGVPAISQDAVLPGDSFTYEFTIRNTGSNMYHSHFNAQKQVPMGLLGAFVIPDPNDPPVAQDVTMVLNDGPLGFTLNGKGFPGTAPIVVNRGETFRIRYMNEGLQIHPMHLHGMAQKVIAKDGHLLAKPRWEDTVLVAPGERVDVLVEATEPGAWAFHCHILNHAESEQGMFGMVTAVIVQ